MTSQRYVVVDANALILGAPLARYVTEHHCKLITVPSVISEIRDPGTRERLERMPFPIATRDPSSEHLGRVVQMARKTGDLASLSKADCMVIALARMIAVEGGMEGALRDEPVKQNWQKEIKIGDPLSQIGDKKASSNDNENNNDSKSNDNKNTNDGDGDGGANVDNNDDGNDDGNDSDGSSSSSGGWITPSNIASVSSGTTPAPTLGSDFVVGVLTADFAMQNVILQMGLKLLSVDGMLIRQLKRWVLRCHACFAVSTDMDRVFCEKCGNQTMQRVAMSLSDDGEMTLHVRRRPPPQRGHKYSIPKPKGGRHGDIILREDQFVEKQMKMGIRRRKDKDDFMDADHMFFTREAAAGRGAGVEVGFGRRNPNVVRKHNGKKKKGRR